MQDQAETERIYVHEEIYDAFVAHFVQTVRGFKIGDPAAEDIYIGTITRAPQLAILDAQVEDALAKGAVLQCGGHRLPGPGSGFEPTVFSQVDHSMLVMQEESLGPIIGIQKASSDEEAVRLMNDTRYGLTAGVFTRDAGRAETVLAQVNAGSV